MAILALAKKKKGLARHAFDSPLYSSPIFANGVLYIATIETLYTIEESSTNAVQDGALHQSLNLSPKESNLPDSAPRSARIGRDRAPDAPFVPTPHDVVARMLEIADVKQDSLVVDLGSGDGRIPIAAAEKYGCKAIGYEIDPKLVGISRETVRKKNLEFRVRLEHEDIFTQDFSTADVVTAFLYPRLLERLIPQLQKLKPGARIVSHQFESPAPLAIRSS